MRHQITLLAAGASTAQPQSTKFDFEVTSIRPNRHHRRGPLAARGYTFVLLMQRARRDGLEHY